MQSCGDDKNAEMGNTNIIGNDILRATDSWTNQKLTLDPTTPPDTTL